ncbi:hypothetical protein [Corallococcus carmarthensis]|uniref:hypothetical protein n=1 Tax=Corallococcus carmarthensis TaxID=2316728 RepID=UPI0011C44E39|nr:hypothetical protein [Corallococcus carmarthensis]
MFIIVDGYWNYCGGAKVNISSDVHMLFGGMYGYRQGGTYVNPYTGSDSCPSGYAPYQLLWTAYIDHPLFFCGRFADGTTEPIADFAGMFGWHANGAYANPITGTTSCPPGYLNQPTYGSPNEDHAVHFCHRPHVAGTQGRYRFGGVKCPAPARVGRAFP